MNELVYYSAGFTEEIGWEWPIAVYLLLAGISGGALIVALAIRFYKSQVETTALYKAAALISCGTILLGMICLVADLTRPLLFWKILINYNWTSVMSIGVAALMLYIPLTCITIVYAFQEKIKKRFSFTVTIIDSLNKVRSIAEIILAFFAVVVCAYTGFLISVLVRFPLLNTSILPALFIVSGLSAGTAALFIVAKGLFKEEMHSGDMKILHKIEWPIMAAEILFILMLYVSLLTGKESSQIALAGFHSGVWSNIFWFGIMGIGFALPLVLNFGLGKKISHSVKTAYISASCSIIGVLCLRLFIVHAGQIFGT